MADDNWALEMNRNIRASTSELGMAEDAMRQSDRAFSRSASSPTAKAWQSKADNISDGMGRMIIGMRQLGFISEGAFEWLWKLKALVEISYASLILYQAYHAMVKAQTVKKLIEAVKETVELIKQNWIAALVIIPIALAAVAGFYLGIGSGKEPEQTTNEVVIQGGSIQDPAARRQMARDTYRGVRV